MIQNSQFLFFVSNGVPDEDQAILFLTNWFTRKAADTALVAYIWFSKMAFLGLYINMQSTVETTVEFDNPY